MQRWRDREMQRYRDAEMERQRDAEMERWGDGETERWLIRGMRGVGIVSMSESRVLRDGECLRGFHNFKL